MAQQGSSLQNYNNELVKCIEDLKEKREEVNRRCRPRQLAQRARLMRDAAAAVVRPPRAVLTAPSGQPPDRQGRGGKGQDTERPTHADGAFVTRQ